MNYYNEKGKIISREEAFKRFSILSKQNKLLPENIHNGERGIYFVKNIKELNSIESGKINEC